MRSDLILGPVVPRRTTKIPCRAVKPAALVAADRRGQTCACARRSSSMPSGKSHLQALVRCDAPDSRTLTSDQQHQTREALDSYSLTCSGWGLFGPNRLCQANLKGPVQSPSFQQVTDLSSFDSTTAKSLQPSAVTFRRSLSGGPIRT